MNEEKVVQKNIWNRLLIVVIILVAALVVLLVFLMRGRSRVLDISEPFTPSGLDMTEYTYGEPFAADLVVSGPSVTIEGVRLDMTTEKGLLFDIDAREPLFAQGIYDKAFPASLTKLMTAILAAKYGNMSDTVIMEESDFDLEEGSQVSGLTPGDVVTMEQLFYALVVYSANDAANAIARHIDGSVEMFVSRMNLEAKALGMKYTHFENPHGLHEKTHYTCAYDVYLMMNEAIRYQLFTDAMRLNVYRLHVQRDDLDIVYDLSSTDKYMTGDESLPAGVTILGGKTGTTDEAGSCLALTVQNRKGQPFIAVIMNAYDKEALYGDMTALLSHINDG